MIVTLTVTLYINYKCARQSLKQNLWQNARWKNWPSKTVMHGKSKRNDRHGRGGKNLLDNTNEVLSQENRSTFTAWGETHMYEGEQTGLREKTKQNKPARKNPILNLAVSQWWQWWQDTLFCGTNLKSDDVALPLSYHYGDSPSTSTWLSYSSSSVHHNFLLHPYKGA